MTVPTNVANIIAARYPGRSMASIATFGEGDFCVAYLVNGDNGNWVFRFARHAEAAASLRREACLLPRIEQHFDLCIPVPRIASTADDPPFVAYPLLPGPPLTPERYHWLPAPVREHCAQQIARFLRQMHATDLALARQCDVPVTQYRARYGEVLARARQHFFKTPAIAAPVRAFAEHAVTAYLASAASSDFQPAVLHGDLSHDHILYDDGRDDEGTGTVSGVIDFGDMAVGDPAWDFVYLYEEYGAGLVARCVRAYAAADPAALLERMYRLFVLDAVAWAVECAEEQSDDLGEAVARLTELQASREQPLRDLLAACDDAPA